MWVQKTSYMWKRLILEPCYISCETNKYLASIMHDSAIFYNKIIDVEAKSNNEEKKTVPTKKILIKELLMK